METRDLRQALRETHKAVGIISEEVSSQVSSWNLVEKLDRHYRRTIRARFLSALNFSTRKDSRHAPGIGYDGIGDRVRQMGFGRSHVWYKELISLKSSSLIECVGLCLGH